MTKNVKGVIRLPYDHLSAYDAFEVLAPVPYYCGVSLYQRNTQLTGPMRIAKERCVLYTILDAAELTNDFEKENRLVASPVLLNNR